MGNSMLSMAADATTTTAAVAEMWGDGKWTWTRSIQIAKASVSRYISFHCTYFTLFSYTFLARSPCHRFHTHSFGPPENRAQSDDDGFNRFVSALWFMLSAISHPFRARHFFLLIFFFFIFFIYLLVVVVVGWSVGRLDFFLFLLSYCKLT